MKFIDLHCDTIARIVEEDLDFTKPDKLHVNLPGIIASNTIVQVFACFVMPTRHPGREFEICNAGAFLSTRGKTSNDCLG